MKLVLHEISAVSPKTTLISCFIIFVSQKFEYHYSMLKHGCSGNYILFYHVLHVFIVTNITDENYRIL